MKKSLSVLALTVVLTACYTPSVPIPPPEPESMSFQVDVATNTASFTFDPTPSYAFAIVYVFNRTQGLGVIETARIDGSVGPSRPFPAELDDEILITFELATQLATTCVRLSDGRSSSANECQ